MASFAAALRSAFSARVTALPRSWSSAPAGGAGLPRYVTGGSYAWNEEISVFLMVVMALAGASAVAGRDSHIRLEFLRRVRDERTFDSPEALRAQILRDVRSAQVYFRRLSAWTHRRCISC